MLTWSVAGVNDDKIREKLDEMIKELFYDKNDIFSGYFLFPETNESIDLIRDIEVDSNVKNKVLTWFSKNMENRFGSVKECFGDVVIIRDESPFLESEYKLCLRWQDIFLIALTYNCYLYEVIYYLTSYKRDKVIEFFKSVMIILAIIIYAFICFEWSLND